MNNKISVQKNKVHLSFTDNFNTLITDIISNITDDNNYYIQDEIFKEIIYYFNFLNRNELLDDNYLVYKGGNTINEVINNFLNNNITNKNENENLIKLKEEYKIYIKKKLDTTKRSDIDFNFNVTLEQSKDFKKINKISNLLYDHIINNDFEINLYNMITPYINNYNLYLNTLENELKKVYNNDDIEIIGIYCGRNLIYNKYDNDFDNTIFYKYTHDINYENIKKNYKNIENNINNEKVLNDIIKLKNIKITYEDNKNYKLSYDDIPENYNIIINEELINNNLPFINSYNDTLFFNGSGTKTFSQFNLIRKKIKFSILYKYNNNNNIYYFNIKSELIDISVNKFQDSIINYINKTKKNNILYNIELYDNKKLYYMNEFINYKQTNIVYNIIDINNMLFNQSYYIWDNKKYLKRLLRFIFLIFILLLSNNDINCYLSFYYMILNVLIINTNEFIKYQNILYDNDIKNYKKNINNNYNMKLSEEIKNIEILFNKLFMKYNIKKYLNLSIENINEYKCMIDSYNYDITMLFYENIIQYKKDIFNLKNTDLKNQDIINYIKFKNLVIDIILKIYSNNILDYTLNITEKNNNYNYKYSRTINY